MPSDIYLRMPTDLKLLRFKRIRPEVTHNTCQKRLSYNWIPYRLTSLSFIKIETKLRTY